MAVNQRRRLSMMIGAKENRSERERSFNGWCVCVWGVREEEARTGNCATFFLFFSFFLFYFFLFIFSFFNVFFFYFCFMLKFSLESA